MKAKIYAMLRSDKKSKKTGECPIYLIVRHNNKSIKIPTEYAVTEGNWINKKDLTRNAAINCKLIEQLNDFNSWVLQRDLGKMGMSEALVRSFFAGTNHNCFYEYYERKIKKEEVSALKKNTVKGYQSNLNVLRLFKKDVLFGEIDLKFIKDFDRYLREKRKLTDSGTYGHHKSLKALLYRAKNERQIKENPYEHGFIMPRITQRLVWLSEKELKEIEELYIPDKNAGLLRTKRLFLFACYTGLRYSDIVTLEWKHIQKSGKYSIIKKEQVKTKVTNSVPLNKKALDLLKIFKGDNSRYVFGKVSNQKLNYNIKTLMEMAEIKKKVSMHTARHTYASILASNGKNVYQISKALGHATLSMTIGYAKVSDESICKELLGY